MSRFEKLLKKIRESPVNVRYEQLQLICEHYFGAARQQGTSHCIYKTGIPEAPRIVIQKDHNGNAKPYQVRQVVKAIDLAEPQEGDHNE